MTGEKKRSNPFMAFLPLILFLGFAGVSYSLLTQDGRQVSALPSALLDKPAPRLTLDALAGGELPGIAPEMFDGKVSVVNVFASWCGPCRVEHPQIEALGKDNRLQLIGLNHKDTPSNAKAFLAELGNPYDAIGVDPEGRASIEWGVYGVPETFFVGPDGIIFYKHVGPISLSQLNEQILPLLETKLGEVRVRTY